MDKGYRTIVYFICVTAALGGLLFGLDQGFLANSLETIRQVYDLDVSHAEHYAAILATGGVLGALLAGLFARFLGRKKSLVVAGAVFCGASLVSATLPALKILFACRFALGFGVGIASFMVPLYLSETAPASIRGAMGTLFQLFITIGIFLISVTNVYIARILVDPHQALPVMFGVIVAFALLMLLGSLILPESPRWLMLKGRREAAVKVVRKILSDPAKVQSEIQDIETALAAGGADFSVIFKGYFIKVLAVGVVLQMFQQLVGINVMIYYAPTIFGYAGMTGLVALLAVPTVNMLFTLPAIKLVEKWGRKKLLYAGALIMLVTMIVLTAVVIYIFGFAVSWGPVAWIVCSEIFPLSSREIGMTVTTMVNWTFAGLLMDNALSLMHRYGNASIFFLFAGFCVLAVAFVAGFVPETRGITLEALENNLKSGKPVRLLGRTG